MNNNNQKELTDGHSPYLLYKSDISYFSGKIEAYLKYKGIPHQAQDIDYFNLNEIAHATGVKKVPAIKTHDNLWLYDSTPMMQWFETRYPQVPILPQDPALRFLTLLLEDYGDEWLWRPAMWWRWVPKASRLSVGWGLGNSLFNRFIARPVGWYFGFRQLHEWLWHDGVDKSNADTVRDMLFREFEFLEPLLEQQPYLMGSHPSAADFGFFASMFRHFGNDPVSAEVMRRQAPNTYEWTARLWNAKPHKLASQQQWAEPAAEFWQPLFKRITEDYLPYLHANAQAWQQDKKQFSYRGKTLTLKNTKTTHYRVYCLEVLQQEYAKLDNTAKQRLESWFGNSELQKQLQRQVIESGLTQELILPRNPVTNPPAKPSLKTLLFGQARN
ncbi:glutathione S-transferase family protein [Bacterioplanoides sp.]|uniref:glutathione S-transferase family protein n=1 Tax=Bacterioplanoides sp. TaxID=2066072 RepID=UPI003B598D1A